MEGIKTIEISSKREEVTAIKKQVQKVKSSLSSCLSAMKEKWKAWLDKVRLLFEPIAKEIADSWIKWEDYQLVDKFIDDVRRMYFH